MMNRVIAVLCLLGFALPAAAQPVLERNNSMLKVTPGQGVQNSAAKLWLMYDLNAQQSTTTLYQFDCISEKFISANPPEAVPQGSAIRVQSGQPPFVTYPGSQLQVVNVGKCKTQ